MQFSSDCKHSDRFTYVGSSLREWWILNRIEQFQFSFYVTDSITSLILSDGVTWLHMLTVYTIFSISVESMILMGKSQQFVI